jgi:hypothetical protein
MRGAKGLSHGNGRNPQASFSMMLSIHARFSAFTCERAIESAFVKETQYEPTGNRHVRRVVAGRGIHAVC